METQQLFFSDFLTTAFRQGDYSTDDVIAFVLPLAKKVLSMHEAGQVAPLGEPGALLVTGHCLDLDIAAGRLPVYAIQRVPEPFAVPVTPTPAYLPGYACYETSLGHHDPQTDIFCLGLLLGSLATGLNLYDPDDLRLWSTERINPTLHHPRIHLALSRLITDMTQLDRSVRTQDLYEVIRRLEHYRDYDTEKQTDLSNIPGWINKDLREREAFILNRLRNRLFDTSRRNRLLYYKPNMRFVNLTVSSVPMVLHYQSIRPELLFTWNEELAAKISGMKEIVLNKYLRFGDHPYLTTCLDRVRVESRRAIQEYGFSQLKLVIAFLNWHDLKEDAAERIQSPLLLVPVELIKNKKVKEDHYVLKVLDNAAEVNPVLAGQLKELYGIRLPDLVDLDEMSPMQFHQLVRAQIEEAGQGMVLDYVDQPPILPLYREARQAVQNYTKKLRLPAGDLIAADIPEPEELPPVVSNPYRWELDVCNMVVGNFNYKKMSLVRDYNLVIDQRLQHPVFDALFSTQPRVVREQAFDGNLPEDWHHVVKADPTQTKAILQSRAGYSYIIQGPPGTGKSQTITNLIADFVARGKNILFVCEKRAALDVVFHRLKQNGLDELCCYIHDSQGDKREFIKDLKATYEDLTATKTDLTAIAAKRAGVVAMMNRQLELLRDFHVTSTSGENGAGIETRQLIERIVALRQELPVLQPIEDEMLPSYPEWQTGTGIIEALATALEETGADPIFADHPFSKINENIFSADNPLLLLEGLLHQSLELLDQVGDVILKNKIDPSMGEHVGALKILVQFAVLLHPLAMSGNLVLADPGGDDAKEFGRRMNIYRQEQELTQEARRKNTYWKERVPEQDLAGAIALAAKYEGNMLAFLNGRWLKLKKHLETAYDLSAHAVRPSFSHILENLGAEYAADRQVAQTKRNLQQEYRIDNIDTTWLSIEVLQQRKGEPALEYLLRHRDAISLISTLQAMRQPLNKLEGSLSSCLQDTGSGPIADIRDALLNIQVNTDSLPVMLPALRAFTILPERVREALRYFPLQPVALEAAIARKTLHEVYQSHRSFAATDRQALDKAVDRLGEGYKTLQELNAEWIRAFIRQRFQQQMDLAGMASSQLNEEQKKFKKTYNEGRKILENEFGKSMRYKSIRELSAKESGRVLKDIKPIWLMSPYSVSDSLPLDRDHFDVVIFDEASQITLEEGVPALYRSQQTIIVGDERQMPPTDFFSAKTGEDPDDLEGHDGEDPDDWLNDDADSLLAQGARKLDSTLLSWHYRSHYETLISFSNHAFYEGSLLTIPDKTIHHSKKPPIEVSAPADAARLADCLFDRSISFHFHPGSIYEKRGNLAEANYIACLVRELMNREIRESIGIVAFSQEQQRTIENALDDLAAEDVIFGQKLEEAYNRTDQDQFTGLIVKNLENIQGDERDIIIMSVCYGPDARKKMLMNFGPINKRGGEKRLNVLFSRAKAHIAVISSIRHQDITNEYNEGANYFRRFLQYAELVSMGQMDAARAILDSLVLQPEQQTEQLSTGVFVQQLKLQIEHLGYEVAEQVGQSGFKCHLAVRASPVDEQYRLGILVDDGKHYRNKDLMEQYYLRPAILTDFGWKVLSVYAKDWLHQPQKVMESIKKALEEPLPQQGNGAHGQARKERSESSAGGGVSDAAEKVVAHEPVRSGGVRGTGTGIYDHLPFERLFFREGAIDKFWEAATDGRRLVVRWGKTGTKGQAQVKTFPDAEAAQIEREKQISEKKEKGYRA